MKRRLWRKAFAACLALTMLFGNSPSLPFSQICNESVITASAATTYSAKFTYNSKSVTMTEDTEVTSSTFLLFDVLTALDIEGSVTDVTVPENNALSAEKKNGVWYLTMSNNYTSGTLKVVIDGAEKEISYSVGQDSLPVALYGLLSFDPAGGEGTLTTEDNGTTYTNQMRCRVGRTYILPECPYTYEGYTFAGWEIRGIICQPGDDYTHEKSTTAKALWRDNNTNEIINQSELVSVTVDPNLQHGTFTVPDETRKGQVIDIIPVPDSGYYIYSVSVNGTKRSPSNGKYTYTMTDAPVIVSGEFKKALDGGTESSPALLNDNEIYFLTGGWYKVSGNITFNHEIIFNNDVHLVLEDGCEMKIQPASQVSTAVFKSDDNNDTLYIHGNTGKLSIPYSSNSQTGIEAGYVEINGGNITLNSYYPNNAALSATNGINVKGGKITINNGQLYSYNGDVIISGGTVNAPISSNSRSVNISGGAVAGTISGYYVNITGGQIDSSSVKSEYSLILGCNEESDSVKIGEMKLSNRSNLVTKIADGIILKDDEQNTYQGSLTRDEMLALAGKTLTFSDNCDADFNVTIGTSYYGTVIADKTVAKYNDKINLTVNSKTGYKVKSVKYGDTEIIPDSDGNYSFNMPRSDVNITAEFEKQKFTVTWKNWDGTVLETDENVEYGSAPFYDGEEPVKVGAVFTGWDNEFSAVTDDVEYTAVFEADDTSAKLIEANTVSVRESVEFNFFADINESQRDGAYVVFSYDHYGETASVHVDIDPDSTYSGHYRFPCPLTASEMNIPVKAELYLADSSAPVSVFTRTIKDYAKSRLEKSTNENEKALISALLNYGGYTQEYLGEGYNLDAMAFDDATKADLSSVNVSSAVTFNRPTEQINGLTYLGSSLLLRDKVACLYYFDVDSGHTIDDYIFKIDGQIATPKHNNIGYYVEGKFRKAYELDDAEKVTVILKTDSSEVFDFYYSVLVYAKTVLMKDLNAEKKTNLARAMYNYYTAARDYVEQSI